MSSRVALTLCTKTCLRWNSPLLHSIDRPVRFSVRQRGIPNAMAKNILIYAEPESGGDEIFEDIKSVLSGAIDASKYSFKRLTHTEASDPGSKWASNCVALFVHNHGKEDKFSENVRKSFANYFLDHGGKLVFLCDPEDGRQSVWFLKTASEYGRSGSAETWPDSVGYAFEKFSLGQTIPSNFQALRIDRGDRFTDFSVGLVRGDSQVSFMYLMCEDGGAVVFVSGRPDKVEERKSGALWRDIMRVLRVIGVDAVPPHTPEIVQCRMDAPCFGSPHVLVYTGPDDRSSAYDKIAGVIGPLIGRKYKVSNLQHADVISPASPCPWWANCVALFVQNDGGHQKFDDKIKRELARYVLSSGKIVLFCNPQDGHRATWLLDLIDPSVGDTTDGVPGQWSLEIGRAFERFVRNEPLPTNVHCVQVKKGDAGADFSVGLVKASDGNTPYMYLRCDDGDTAVFVGAKAEDAIERSVPVWLDLLRLVGLGPTE